MVQEYNGEGVGNTMYAAPPFRTSKSAAIVLAVWFGFALIVASVVAHSIENDWKQGLPPCPTEDSDNCYWDAQNQGDGFGYSFIVKNGEVQYHIW